MTKNIEPLMKKYEELKDDMEDVINQISFFFQKHYPVHEMGKEPSDDLKLFTKLFQGIIQTRMGIKESDSAILWNYLMTQYKIAQKAVNELETETCH